jgi:hypothetical protein
MVDEFFRLWLETDEQTEWSQIGRDYGDYCPVIVSGVYSHGPSGHLRIYPGQIVKIKSIKAAAGGP